MRRRDTTPHRLQWGLSFQDFKSSRKDQGQASHGQGGGGDGRMAWLGKLWDWGLSDFC